MFNKLKPINISSNLNAKSFSFNVIEIFFIFFGIICFGFIISFLETKFIKNFKKENKNLLISELFSEKITKNLIGSLVYLNRTFLNDDLKDFKLFKKNIPDKNFEKVAKIINKLDSKNYFRTKITKKNRRTLKKSIINNQEDSINLKKNTKLSIYEINNSQSKELIINKTFQKTTLYQVIKENIINEEKKKISNKMQKKNKKIEVEKKMDYNFPINFEKNSIKENLSFESFDSDLSNSIFNQKKSVSKKYNEQFKGNIKKNNEKKKKKLNLKFVIDDLIEVDENNNKINDIYVQKIPKSLS